MNNTTFIPYQRLELQSMGTEKLLNIIESFNIAISFIGERKSNHLRIGWLLLNFVGVL